MTAHDTEIEANQLFKEQIQHYTNVLQNIHDQMIHYIDDKADKLIDHLKQLYNNNEQLPTSEELQQQLPLIINKQKQQFY